MQDPRQFAVDKFPSWTEAPNELSALEDSCGPLSMWMVTKALGRELDTQTIVRACRFVSGGGMWPVRLALAFHELGFKVEYRSHSVQAPEAELHKEAKAKGMSILPPLALRVLLDLPAISIISYKTINGGDHFTPALGMRDGSLYLPLDYEASVQAIETVETQRKHADLGTITVFADGPF